MNFNIASAGTVTIQHAKYGTDGTSTWELWQSANSGSTLVEGRLDCYHQLDLAHDRHLYRQYIGRRSALR